MQYPLFVTGMHNSGTSLLARLLKAAGVDMCDDMAHCECRYWSIDTNNWIMRQHGGWYALPIMSEGDVLDYKSVLVSAHAGWHYKPGEKWGLKDPRLCVLLLAYKRVFPRATVIYIHRDPADIANSLSGKHKAEIGLKNDYNFWYNLTLQHQCRAKKYANIYIEYEKLCMQPVETVSYLLSCLHLPYTGSVQKVISGIKTDRIRKKNTYKI
jgi:hypothetical protein